MTSQKRSRRIKADIETNDETLRLLFTNHPTPMWIYDLKTLAFLDVNDAALEKYGYTRDEFLALTIKDIRPTEDVTLLINSLEQKSTALHHSGEWRHCLKNGQVIDGEITTHTLDFKGQKATLVMAQDITERRQAEDKLRESEKEFHSLAEAMPQIVWITKPDGWNIYFNQQWVDYTGQTLEESYGHGWNKPFHPDDQQRAWDAWQNATKNSAVYSLECRLRRVDGVYTWWLIRGVPLMDAHGNILKWFGTCTDIHEIKQAEEKILQLNATLENRVEERTSKLREAQEQLVRQEKLAVLGQMAGGVGHELRNPLAVINNALYLLKLVNANGSEKVQEYLGIIQTETHTAEKIITDLLDFARIKSLDVEVVSVSELIHKTLERFPASPSVKVLLEIPERLPPVCADPHHMEQVLGNLVTNACQAMVSSAGMISSSGELTIAAHQEQGMIAIAVQDTGVGITPENMKKIFEPLFTTKAKGIGLGLAVSQKLAEANGSRIEVQSEAGKGSTFTVFLPIKAEAYS